MADADSFVPLAPLPTGWTPVSVPKWRRGLDPKVIDGTEVTSNEFPYVARLQTNRGVCTSTVIHPNWVITAANCVKGISSARIMYDGYKTADLTRVDASSYHYFPGYNASTLYGDVALVRAETPMTVSRKVILNDFFEEEELRGAQVHFVGWGSTTGVDVLPVTQFQGTGLVADKDGEACPYRAEFDGKFCVVSNPGNVCFGDSGGPIFYDTHPTSDGYQVLTSTVGAGNCNDRGTGATIFSINNIPGEQKAWIDGVMGGDRALWLSADEFAHIREQMGYSYPVGLVVLFVLIGVATIAAAFILARRRGYLPQMRIGGAKEEELLVTERGSSVRRHGVFTRSAGNSANERLPSEFYSGLG